MAVAESFRQESGRIVAGLIRLTGDWDLVEECTQDAFAEALRTWPETGTPRRPGAWLTTVARNCAYDRLRRASTETAKLKEVAVLADQKGLSGGGVDLDADGGSGIRDDRLRLMFTCCHPALPIEARVALTLRTLAGLTTAEIARAFLVPEQTMAKRLGGADLAREGLCAEAIRLTRALVELMPGESEPAGLLALMLLQHSRRGARVDSAGNLITLEDQDRGLWHREEIDEATRLLERTLRARRIGPYQLQAAIAACHTEARRAADTNWAEISALYACLAELMPSPIVELNRAVAVAMADGPAAGLVLMEALEASGRLGGYHLLPALRADLLRRLGRRDDAAASYRRALHLTGNDAERRYLSRRLDETCGGGSAGSVTATPAERANGGNDQRRWARPGPPLTALC
ncbi:RNA polymerase sigma factor [Salinispora mooreana]|uniref:RNA polymerase sigma factor n=1 Tax=Salinispora mooreana TaxID=999545 RepID=UPI00036E0183|nr:DUF6596 domain-containing protein [Salinispora mooreana]